MGRTRRSAGLRKSGDRGGEIGFKLGRTAHSAASQEAACSGYNQPANLPADSQQMQAGPGLVATKGCKCFVGPLAVITGLGPAIHEKSVDHRAKPGDDEVGL